MATPHTSRTKEEVLKDFRTAEILDAARRVIGELGYADASMERIAQRMAGLGTETAFEILARAKKLEAQGRDVVHLEIGEPDFDTPPNIVDAGADALREGFTHYGPSAGLPPALK